MPTYDYRCGRCGKKFTLFAWVKDYERHVPCPDCANGMGNRVLGNVNFAGQEENWPIESLTLGVPEHEIKWRREHYRKMGCPTEFNKDGDAILTSPSHRMKLTMVREKERREAREAEENEEG